MLLPLFTKTKALYEFNVSPNQMRYAALEVFQTSLHGLFTYRKQAVPLAILSGNADFSG